MVRPRVASGFAELAVSGLASMYPAFDWSICSGPSWISARVRAYGSTNGTNGSGDGDAINCLTPALALFKAGVQVPAIAAQEAVPATATTPAIPAVTAVPAQDPGPILLYQKYRELTLSGGLTACQTWFNGPINATTAAGIAGAGTVAGAAALLAPK
jgi:hypothetical protein